MPSLIGNKPNQVPSNGDLGTLAFQDANAVNITGGVVDVSAGTAALPSLGTTGDENTGLFFPAADTVAVSTNGVERARVDSAGNVGIGATPSTWSLGKSLEIGTVGNCLWGAASADLRLLAGSYFNSGFKYAVSSQAVAKYEISGGSHAWFTAPSGTAGNAVTFTQAMTLNANGALVLQGGNTSASGVGVAFPATQSASSDANTLDDYEEGTWTPTFTSSGTQPVVAYSVQIGNYTKIGKFVYWSAEITVTAAASGTGTLQISGLPFTAGASRYVGGGVVTQGSAWTATMPNSGYIYQGTTYVSLNYYTGTATAATNAANLTNTTSLIIYGSYLA